MKTYKHTIKKLAILITLLTGLSTVAQAGTLSDEVVKYVKQGYQIIGSGIVEEGSDTYWIKMFNIDGEHPLIVCEKRYDSKKTDCYIL